MYKRVMFGNLINFDVTGDVTRMFVNGGFVCDLHSSGNIERDINLLMLGYAE